MPAQTWVLLAVLGLALASLVATRPRTRKPVALVVLVAALVFALGAV